MTLSQSELIMLSTTKIIMFDDSGGEIGTATGFFYAFCENHKTFQPALVTNRHVLAECNKVKIAITRTKDNGEPNIGKFDVITIPTNNTLFHPNPEIDIAVLPVGELLNFLLSDNRTYAIQYLHDSLLPTYEDWNNLNAIENVTMVGYPKGLADYKNNLPIIRKGITATHPKYDLNGIPHFLIDVACFKGSSGSPVFILEEGLYTDVRNNAILPGPRIKFLGILYAVPNIQESGQLISTDKNCIDESTIPIHSIYTNLGYVIKSTQLQVFHSMLQTANQ